MFAILTFGPRLANAGGLVQEFLVNTVCILLLMVLGCHNVVMFNHSTLLLCYLLLYGYDVTGDLYIQRLIAMGIGAAATLIVYYRNHRKKYINAAWGIFLRSLISIPCGRDGRSLWYSVSQQPC